MKVNSFASLSSFKVSICMFSIPSHPFILHLVNAYSSITGFPYGETVGVAVKLRALK